MYRQIGPISSLSHSLYRPRPRCVNHPYKILRGSNIIKYFIGWDLPLERPTVRCLFCFLKDISISLNMYQSQKSLIFYVNGRYIFGTYNVNDSERWMRHPIWYRTIKSPIWVEIVPQDCKGRATYGQVGSLDLTNFQLNLIKIYLLVYFMNSTP